MSICPICQEEGAEIERFNFPAYRIFTCRNCLVRFCQPLVDNRTVYTSEFIARKKEYLEPEFSEIHPKLAQYITGLHQKRILDIGCGAGWFLDALKDSNDVLGLEGSVAYESILNEKGIPCRIGDLEQQLSLLPEKHYDVITMWDVFEHLYDPMAILRLVKQKLADDGILINWTNNYDDAISRFAELTYVLSFGRVKTFIEQSFNRIYGHNYNFVDPTLRFVYERTGLEIVDSLITDTSSERLATSVLFKGALELFYLLNRLAGKGKIICHVVKKPQ